MVARPNLSIPMDQPDFGDGRDYAPGHVEVFEERTGEIIGRYDPRTQPIAELIDLVHQAVEDRRRPDVFCCVLAGGAGACSNWAGPGP
jgi:hypothetical protein